MSTVPHDGPRAGPEEEVSAELDAMHAVGHALARLRNPRARARVLRWAAERFEMPSETAPSNNRRVAPPVATCPIDESMMLDGVLELFDAPSQSPEWAILHLETTEPPHVHHVTAAQPPVGCETAEPEPLDSLVRGLASDFQRFAVEWQGA